MQSHFNSTFILSDFEIGILSFVNAVFSVGGSIGNIFVCFAFVLYRNLRNNMNIFILSLACSDLLVCVIAQPMFVVSLVNSYQQDNASNLFEGVRKRLTWVSLLASAGNLLGVTLDRYFAVSDPLRYPARVTTTRASLFVVIVWAVAIGLGTTTQSFKRTKMIGQIYVFFMLACLICPVYCRVLCIARKHARVIQTAISLTTSLDKNARQFQTSLRSGIRKADKNSLKTVGIITSIFVLGWFPLLILPFVYRGKVHDRKIMLQLFQWVNTLALCSSAWNPVVYSWRDRRFRTALCMVYSRWAAKRIDSSQNNIRRDEKLQISTPS